MSRPLRSIAEWARDKQIEETDPAKRLRSTGIPEQYLGMTWSGYRKGAGTHDEELRDILMDYDEHWSPDVRQGLALLGAPGCGKTRGMATLGVALAQRAWVKWTTEADLDVRRKALIGLERQGEATEDWEAYNRAAMALAFIEIECDVLFLDDVGKAYRSASGYADTQLDLLLRRRWAAGKVTCLSSNFPHEDWVQFDPSMASFLHEMSEIVSVTTHVDFRSAPPANKARRARR